MKAGSDNFVTAEKQKMRKRSIGFVARTHTPRPQSRNIYRMPKGESEKAIAVESRT